MYLLGSLHDVSLFRRPFVRYRNRLAPPFLELESDLPIVRRIYSEAEHIWWVLIRMTFHCSDALCALLPPL